MKALGCLLVAVILVVAVAEITLPSIAQQAAKAEAEKMAGPLGASFPLGAKVEVKSVPAIKYVAGYIDTLTLRASPARVGSVEVDTLLLEASRVSIDPVSVMTGRPPTRPTKYGSFRAVMIVTEGTITKKAQEVIPLAGSKVTLAGGKARVSGSLPILGRTYKIDIVGGIGIAPPDRKRLFFFIDQIELDGRPASAVINAAVRQVLGDKVLLFDAVRERIPLIFQEVSVQPESLRIIAGLENQ
ncbi:MAG: hypothetical protein Q8P50_13980 [Bacillota bacterium]|nr:hypothetical protein [Bacillota bacterium]